MLNKHRIHVLSLERNSRIFSDKYFEEHGVLRAVIERQRQATASTPSLDGQTRTLVEPRILQVASRLSR